MPTFNRVILVGNLTKDPELRYTSGGTAIANFSLAVNYKTGKGDTKKDEVDFFDIETWEKTAELASQYLKKGSSVLIEGRLKQDRWEDESGKKRSRIKIVASEVQFLDSKKDSGANSQPEDNEKYSGGNSDMAPF